MTPLLIHRKLPVTARTAGRCDRPEAPTATPAFILLFFSSSVKSPEGKCPLSKEGETAAQNWPESAWRGRASPHPQSGHTGAHTAKHRAQGGLGVYGYHSGSIRLTQGQMERHAVSCRRGFFLLHHRIFCGGHSLISFCFSAFARKVGPGFRPETVSAAARGKPDALLAPPVGG